MHWLSEHKELFTVTLPILIALATFIWQVLNGVQTRKQETKNKDFEAYHQLIGELVQPKDGATYVDRQIACLFELRRFKRYREVTLRILDGLANDWSNFQSKAARRLLKELDLTRRYLRTQK